MKPRFVLAGILVVLAAVMQIGALPLLDEESYLDMARQLDFSRPYDWWRPWQPWGHEQPDDAYLFAHPPGHLWWIAAVGGTSLAARLFAVLPFAALLGFSAGALSERYGGWMGVLLFATSPILWLSLQAGMLPDLPVAALGTAAVAAWVWRKPVWAGLALAAAASWKYPALVLVLVFAIDGWRDRRALLRLLGAFALPWLGLQLYLAFQYGEPHLWHVLSTAPEIGRGPIGGRALGTLFRLGLACPPAWLGPVTVSSLLGGGLALVPEADGRWILVVLGVLGAALLLRVLEGLLRPRRAPERLLAIWVLLVLASVVLGHNYAGGRYLLPAVLPLALLVGARLPRPAAILALPFGALALSMVLAERAHAQASGEIAEMVSHHAPARFTGEWTFRHAMTEDGHTFWSPGEPLSSGDVLIVPTHSSPAPIPEGLVPIDEVHSTTAGSFRLVDLEVGIGYHAETLGPLPLGFGEGPRESARVYRAP